MLLGRQPEAVMRRRDRSTYSCSRRGVRGWGLPVCHLRQRLRCSHTYSLCMLGAEEQR